MLLHQCVQRRGPPSNRDMCDNLRFGAADAFLGFDGTQSPEHSILLLLHVSTLHDYRMEPGILLE